MFSLMWFLSLVSLLMVDIGTGATQQKVKDAWRCYSCRASNSTSCDQLSSMTIIDCLEGCATVAVAPNFTSSLQCAEAPERACSLNYSRPLQLGCRCAGHLCNAPFSPQLTNDLLNFSSTLPNKTADLTETFFKIYSSVNFTAELYKTITVPLLTTTEQTLNITTISTTAASVKTTTEHREMNQIAPRAEPLKQEAAAPSDDDEDESEGSGAYEETRSQKNPASAPAAPSSFLPADENKSPPLFTHLFLTTPFLMYFIV